MASPIIFTPSSPIFTPAALQGEPPIWAVPTPSPSPMVRCPKESRLEGERGGGGSTGSESPLPSLVSQEMLWQVCQPFIGQMLEALVKSIHQAQTEQLQSFQPQQNSGASEREADSFGGAFSSVFEVPKKRESLSRLAEDDGELGSAASSSCPSPKTEHVQPQKVTCSSSKESSPVNQGKEPSFQMLFGATGSSAVSGSGSGEGHSNSSLPQKVHSPSMPEISEKHMPTDVVPMYLAWQQQHPGAIPPGVHQRWADQRLSPTVSPMVPVTSPPSEGSATQLVLQYCDQMDRKGSVEEASSPDAPTTGSGDKSVMVCRHWKSKGWCRLEGNCKFLHPEHKKGPTLAPAPKAGGGTSGSAPSIKTGSEAPGTSTTSTAKRSRRSGRKRTSGNAVAQAVAVGPLGNSMNAPSPGSS